MDRFERLLLAGAAAATILTAQSGDGRDADKQAIRAHNGVTAQPNSLTDSDLPPEFGQSRLSLQNS